MNANQIRLTLVNKAIERSEVKLAALKSQEEATQSDLDKLYTRRRQLEADIRMEERDTAELRKTQPAGVRIGGIQV